MYVKEVFSGLNFPKADYETFDNKYNYDQMLVEKDITFYSHCEHHFVPIFGKAHVAYFSSGKVIGLSKINRIVQYFSKRPQVQERLTVQIAKELKKALKTEDAGRSHGCQTHVFCQEVLEIPTVKRNCTFSGKFNDLPYASSF